MHDKIVRSRTAKGEGLHAGSRRGRREHGGVLEMESKSD